MIYAAYVQTNTKWALIGFGRDRPEAEMKLEVRLRNAVRGTKSQVVAYKMAEDAPEYLDELKPEKKPATKKKPVAKKPVVKKVVAKKKPVKKRKPRKKKAGNIKGFDAYKHLWIQTKGRKFIVWNEKQTRKLGTYETLRGARRFIGFNAKKK